MCEGRLLAEVVLGDVERPCVPSCAEGSLTQTIDGRWGLWAHKVAFDLGGGSFRALTHTVYPSDAAAACSRGDAHRAPDANCTCGFHAFGTIDALRNLGIMLRPEAGVVLLDVFLTGRVLVLHSDHIGVLFRAERQTVVALNRGGRPAELTFALPPGLPIIVTIDDDPGLHALLERPVSSLLDAVRLAQPTALSFSDERAVAQRTAALASAP